MNLAVAYLQAIAIECIAMVLAMYVARVEYRSPSDDERLKNTFMGYGIMVTFLLMLPQVVTIMRMHGAVLDVDHVIDAIMLSSLLVGFAMYPGYCMATNSRPPETPGNM